jgi:uncharacterized protein (UPF0276 family)
MNEWEFVAAVVREADCGLLLDVNNVFVSSRNHGFDPLDYLRAMDFSRVLQVHVAGHSVEPDGTLVDTHDHPVTDDVWALYARAWEMGGPFPTLLEWDERIPPLDEALTVLARARTVREGLHLQRTEARHATTETSRMPFSNPSLDAKNPILR